MTEKTETTEENIQLPSAGEMESMIWSDDDQIKEEETKEPTGQETEGDFVLPDDLSNATTISEEGDETKEALPEFPDYKSYKEKMTGPASEQIEVAQSYGQAAFEAAEKYKTHFEKLKGREASTLEEKTKLEQQLEEFKTSQSNTSDVTAFNNLVETDEEIKGIQQEAVKLIDGIARKAPAFRVDWQKLLENFAALPHDQPEKLTDALKTFKEGLPEIREEYAGREDAIVDALADGLLVKDRAETRMNHIRENFSEMRFQQAESEYKKHLDGIEKWQSSFEVNADDPNDPVRLAIAVINANPKVREAVKKQHEISVKHSLPVNPEEWKADPSKSISLATEHAKTSAGEIRKLRQLAARAIAYENIIPELQKKNRTLSARLKDQEISQPPPPSGETKKTGDDEPHIPSAEEMNAAVYR